MKTCLTILVAVMLLSAGAMLAAGCWYAALSCACGALTCWLSVRDDAAADQAEAERAE